MAGYHKTRIGILCAVILCVSMGYGQDKGTSVTVLPESLKVKKTDYCAECHKTLRGKNGLVVSMWSSSIHAKNSGACNRCHGGNPNTQNIKNAKRAADNYVGVPAKTNTIEFCGRGGCHRPTIRVFAKSPHNTSVKKQGEPNCVSCHGSHNIQAPNTGIISEELCARCHPAEMVKKVVRPLVRINEDIHAIMESIAYLQRKSAETSDIAAELVDAKIIFHRVVHGFSSEDVQFRRKEVETIIKNLKQKIETRVLIARRLEMLYFITVSLSFGLIVFFSIYALRMYSKRRR